MTFLVISCPCSLVISIPLTFFAGIGGAGKAGILVKGADSLEILSKVRKVVLDKTGTLTKGSFEVTDVLNAVIPEKQVLDLAACVEHGSIHPIARGILSAAGEEPDCSRVSEWKEHTGNGMSARVDGMNVLTGNDRMMRMMNIDFPLCNTVGKQVHVATDGRYLGTIILSDKLKPGSREAVENLKNAGISAVMMTGDQRSIAERIGQDLGIDEIYSELLPTGKVENVEKLMMALPEGDKLAFVGDGINDAPVLSRVDLGIAMGGLGSDAAMEAADIVLMDDDPGKIMNAIKISGKCMHIVYENIALAIGVKLLCLILVAIGIASMGIGVFADVGVMMIAVLNAIRAMYFNRENGRR